ncbi:peptidoglycan editing factor PgeF [Pseudonocardia sp. HH130630-07]|uniref:peptidoglycan editing factor PgeF n=1 Tax=Pseudonocardia sp. HH130630-07 TaxID=1690815 RepID=UPI000815197D|nr:peptidoglycan editing factor PgeF [Pseudonocardia sp. HH130630-07]ANY09676.1 laccase [Pseudonocardia sp. HH130630-07]
MTTRAGGRSAGPFTSFNLSRGVGDDPGAVTANRARIVRELGLSGLVFLTQVHGTGVAVLREPPRARPGTGGVAADVPDTDAVVTDVPLLGIAVLAADCVPVLLGDPVAGVVGAAHAGRVGAASGVLDAVVGEMAALGAEPGRLEVLLGPAVCGRCYEVPAAMRAEVEAVLPGSASTTRTGTAGLDLRAGLTRRLAALGVTKVGTDPRCTIEDPDLFSHRREGRCGRQAAITWLDPRGARDGAAGAAR